MEDRIGGREELKGPRILMAVERDRERKPWNKNDDLEERAAPHPPPGPMAARACTRTASTPAGCRGSSGLRPTLD